MKKAHRTIAKRSIPMLFTAILLSACGNAATPEPTVDMNVFPTTIAQTMVAEYTASAVVLPTDAPVSTDIPASGSENSTGSVVVLPIPPANSSSDMIVNPYTDPAAATEEPVIIRNNNLPEVSSNVSITLPTAAVPTAARTGNEHGDKASYDSQSPLDGVHVERGSEFDVIWYLKNTGSTTWTTDYCLRYFTGTDFTKPGKTRYYLNEPVPPDTIGKCIVDALAPEEPGTYKMSVVLGNENDENFFIVDITIVVD